MLLIRLQLQSETFTKRIRNIQILNTYDFIYIFPNNKFLGTAVCKKKKWQKPYPAYPLISSNNYLALQKSILYTKRV